MFFLLSKKALLNEMVHNPEHKTPTGKETTRCLDNRDCVLAVSFPETVVQTASPALYILYIEFCCSTSWGDLASMHFRPHSRESVTPISRAWLSETSQMS